MVLDVKNSGILYDERRNPIFTKPENEVAFGNVPGRFANAASGFNKNIGTAVETVWACGGLWNVHDTAELFNFVSTSVNDALGGTGGFALLIMGIGEDWKEYEENETVILDGLTPVQTTRVYRVILRMVIVGAGALRTNDGEITATGADTGFTEGCIPATYGLSRQALTGIPVDRERLVEEISFSGTITTAGAAPRIIVQIHYHDMANDFSIVAYEESFDASVGNIVIENPLDNVPFPGQGILEMTAVSTKINTEVYGRLKWCERTI